MNEMLVHYSCFKNSFSKSVFFFSCKIDFRESVTKPINHLDITQSEKFKNHSKTEIDFNHLGMEEESDSDDESLSELEKMISELEDKPKPNLEEADIINIGTVENPRELKIDHQLTQEHKYEQIGRAHV